MEDSYGGKKQEMLMTTTARKIEGDIRSAEMEEESMSIGHEARPRAPAGLWYDPSPFFPHCH